MYEYKHKAVNRLHEQAKRMLDYAEAAETQAEKDKFLDLAMEYLNDSQEILRMTHEILFS